jgi:hypothetical protein
VLGSVELALCRLSEVEVVSAFARLARDQVLGVADAEQLAIRMK